VTERHERVARLLREGGPVAPETLHRRVQETLRRPPKPRRPPLLRLPVVAATGAAVVIALVLALTAVTGGGEPSVDTVADLSDVTPTESTPAPDPSQPTLLRREFEGVAFPNWSKRGWKPVGARTDEIDGRSTESVYYQHEGHRISYTVIGGEPVDPPSDAVAVRVGGVDLNHVTRGHREIVTFLRNGRTCVVAGHFRDSRTALELASWQGDGTIRF
jgi:hypothetical protein